MSIMPNCSVEPGNVLSASWDDPSDARYFIARFIGSEIHLLVSNVDDFLKAIKAVQQRKVPTWDWHGNSYSVHLDQNGCVIRDHYADLCEGQQAKVDLSLDDYRTILTAWKTFVSQRFSPADPWLTAPGGRGGPSKKKTARLAGMVPGSGKVHLLIKLHDWAGRAIYIYNLVNGETCRISRPSQEIWDQYSKLGVEIPHPGKIQVTDVTRWLAYAKKEAERRGLQVEE